jgi:hypothetical protein
VTTRPDLRVGRTFSLPLGISGDAEFSEDGRYRWTLRREFAGQTRKPVLVAIGMNPSGAGASVDDPTIRVLENLAIRLNLGGLVMLNAYARIATDSGALLALPMEEAIGERNDDTIALLLKVWGSPPHNATILACWGQIPVERHVAVRKLLYASGLAPAQIVCLGTRPGNFPRHPLRTGTAASDVVMYR